MRIGIDAIHLSRSRKGASRFEHSLIKMLAKQSSEHSFVVFLDCEDESLNLPNCDSITYASFQKHNLLTWEQYQLPLAARRHKVHCLLTLADRLPMVYEGTIVTYLFEVPLYRHRLNRVTGSSTYQVASDMLSRLIFPWSLARSSRIAVASKATGLDLQTRYGVSNSQIEVVYSGVDDVFKPANDPVQVAQVREFYGAPGGYVLHFSTGDPRENTSVALAAFAQAQLPQATKMIIAGGDASSYTELIAEFDLTEQVISVDFQKGQALLEIYQAASGYLDPSLYEGFGFQALEAMACGVPVICSNTSSLPEVVGHAAMTYSPSDVMGFSRGLETIINRPDQALEMRKAGVAQSGLFSWERTVRQLIGVCEKASG